MRIALFYYILAKTISGVSINRDTSSTRGKAGGSPLTPLQYNLIFCSFEPSICFFPGQAVDSAHLHEPPFNAPSGGGLGNPPTNSIWLMLVYELYTFNKTVGYELIGVLP
jgi:hypothetical protein